MPGDANPLVSIIIPVYNVEQYVRRCIESCLSQTYSNIEIIIVEDCSTDGSGEICRTYLQTDHRIKYIQNDCNCGLSVSRNKGLLHSTGEWIFFVDSDDYINRESLEQLVSAAYKYESKCVIASNITSVSDGLVEEGTNTSLIEDVTVYRDKDILFELVKHNNIINYSVWGKLWNRSLFFDGPELIEKFAEGKAYEDIMMTSRLLTKVEKVVCIPYIVYNYQLRAGSIIHHRTVKNAADRYDAAIERNRILAKLSPNIMAACIDDTFNAVLSLWTRYIDDKSGGKKYSSAYRSASKFSRNNYKKWLKTPGRKPIKIIAFFTMFDNRFSYWVIGKAAKVIKNKSRSWQKNK